ncbi:MAG TPA: response regulator transcription factor [Bacteriovoracaceae bacterium]|nr:response regulator transcription factor [Bacteriovoracaceae bacterium]
MSKLITIIEDEKDILDALKVFLEDYGYVVKGYGSAHQFFSQHDMNEKGLYLIDWNLPGISGIEIVKTIRAQDKLSPIFMMSANNKDEQVILGLKTGADDYIRKPFNADELLARLNNAQTKTDELKDKLFDIGIKLIPESAAFMKDGVPVALTDREYLIFETLYQSKKEATTREELLAQFGPDNKMSSRNIDVHVFSLRKKMEKVHCGIDTVWGKGYKIRMS